MVKIRLVETLLLISLVAFTVTNIGIEAKYLLKMN